MKELKLDWGVGRADSPIPERVLNEQQPLAGTHLASAPLATEP